MGGRGFRLLFAVIVKEHSDGKSAFGAEAESAQTAIPRDEPTRDRIVNLAIEEPVRSR